jgi:hypothetical protein
MPLFSPDPGLSYYFGKFQGLIILSRSILIGCYTVLDMISRFERSELGVFISNTTRVCAIDRQAVSSLARPCLPT